jgi:3-oxoacyl-[acyl-carrier protein] reductase
MKKFSFLQSVFTLLLLFVSGYAADQMQPNTSCTFLVTCASGELGAAIAKELASENNLILTGRNTFKLQQLQKELQAQHPWSYEIVELDYCDQRSLLNFESFLKTRIGEISGLVLITPRPQFGSSLLQSESNWFTLFQTTFTGPLEALKSALPYFASQGKIAIIGGITSVQLLPEYGPSCIVRRMWTTYAKALSHQLGPKGISVNVLSPGVVLTHFHEERIANKAEQHSLSYQEQMGREVASIPMRRHALPEEVAKSVKFLLSSDSNFINGVNLVLDGGATVSY